MLILLNLTHIVTIVALLGIIRSIKYIHSLLNVIRKLIALVTSLVILSVYWAF